MHRLIFTIFLLLILAYPCLAQGDKDNIVGNALDVIEYTNALLTTVGEEKADQEPASEGQAADNQAPSVAGTSSQLEGAPEVPAEKTVLTLESVDFVETDVKEALDMIAQKSGLKIVPEGDIQGHVTLALMNIDVYDLLKILADELSLAFVKENGSVRVMTALEFEHLYGRPFVQEQQSRIIRLSHAESLDIIVRLNQIKSNAGKIIQAENPKTIILLDTPPKVEEMLSVIKSLDVAVKTEVFILRYAQPKEIEEEIKPFLSKDVGQVVHDERSQKIVVTDTVENIKEIAKRIEESDVIRAVIMDAEAIQVVLTDEYSEGIDWEAIVSNYYCLGFDESSCKEGKRDLSVGTINQEDYDVLKEALDTVGEVDVIAGPTIKSVTGSRTYLRVSLVDSDVVITMANPSHDSFSVKKEGKKDSGVQFYLTPVVHLDNTVSLEITTTPVSSSPGGGVGTEQKNKQALLNIENDSIVVIGGMFKEEQVKKTKKFPLLGDIPLVGLAFRRQRYNTVRTEHVIFLRLKPIVTDSEK